MAFMIRTVVTQNIHGFPNFVRAKKHISLFMQKIKPYSPDIILLQEVFREKWLLKNTLELNGYLALYKTNPLFIEGGLVILIKKSVYDHFIYKGYHFQLFYQDYNQQGIIRSAQVVSHISKKGYLHLKIININHTIDIINTHTTSAFNKREEKLNKKLKVLLSQLIQFESFLLSLPYSTKIIGGDFNYDIILGSNCFDKYSHYPNIKSITFPKHMTRIDFILTQNLTIGKGKILKTSSDKISDHNGILIFVNP
jgi:endonuclease/exonuclease/phosphatase family metal-dependent hydrolase